jgi:capsular exopolysaccharide synthesis family protein
VKDLSPYFINRTGPEVESDAFEDSESWDRSSLDLREYWVKVQKHYRVILASFVTVVLLAAMAVFTAEPRYTAQATLLIERNAPNVLDIRQVINEPLTQDQYDYYKTQYELLRSRSLAAEVIREQSLDKNSAFSKPSRPSLLAQLLAQVSAMLTKPASRPTQQQSEVDGVPVGLINTYLADLQIAPVVGTKLVTVGFTSSDPVLSASVARQHSLAYIRQGLSLQSGANDEARQFLDQKLVELKDRLEKSEAALNAYRRDKGIISLDDKENTAIGRFDNLSRERNEAELERITLESQEELIRKQAYDALPAVINSLLIQNLKQEVARNQAEYAATASSFKPGYPAFDQVRARLDESEARLRHEIRNVAAGIESGYKSARAKEELLKQTFDEQKKIVLDQKDAGVQYAILAREVDTNRDLYNTVVKRAKETEVEADVKASNIYMIDRPEVPLSPSHPRKLRAVLTASFLGVVVGLCLAFLIEALDNTFKNSEDVKRYLNLPTLAAVPTFAALGAKNLRTAKRAALLWAVNGKNSISSTAGNGNGKELFAAQDRLAAAEYYRTIRGAILLSRAGEPPKVTMFTSAVDSEGKTLTAVNTATSFARMDAKVLLIDADLRRPRCHTLLNVANEVGLTEVLTGRVSIDDALVQTHVKGLFVLPCGTRPPNPAELVGSMKMKEVLSGLREVFDYIVIDTVPMLLVSDALLLSRMVDGTVLVVNGSATPKHLVAEAYSRLHYAGSKVLGIVLNNVDLRNPEYYYGSYNGYARYDSDDSADEHA